ncbi:MAG: ribosomal protein S18-alanine N-acetyltransferase [Nitrospirae bacterium]|nr:ribosomal protein S18-alanine N-acetyltransferase [Nitrospirota bacterium]
MDKLVIRDMGEEDILEVVNIEQVSFSTPWSEQSFLRELYRKYSIMKVAVFRDKIIGYICADYKFHEACILNLAVHPDYRRRGVATILMNNVINELKNRGCVFLYLKVRFSNTGAKEFYKRFGFKTESIRKKYYSNPDEDALVMMGRL